ncbi:MAG: DeoR family transcriptional regulator [Pelagibacterales bacterium]|nr:DeoR family transcriptional regulator [Pelagibacterales bacterium]
MEKQKLDFIDPIRVSPIEVYEQFTKNYQYLITEFFEYQLSWFYRAYVTFKDFDKYIILAYFFKKNLFAYADLFQLKTYDEYYSLPFIELDKLNIIEISKELRISKETARRKLLQLEKEGIISKDNKKININHKNINKLIEPHLTIKSFSRLLSSISHMLYKNNKVNKAYDRKFFESRIKKKYTQCWAVFLEFQIDYVLARSKIFNNDTELFFIMGALIYNQNLSNRKNSSLINYRDEWWRTIANIDGKRGLNAMTISELTGIPRPTVIRKLKILLDRKDAVKDKNSLYGFVRGPGYQAINKVRLQNIEKLSKAISRINNIIFFS